MIDDFSNHPVSLGEAKADRAHDAALWTPREALISVLRDIDSGKLNPDHLIVIAATIVDDRPTSMAYRSSIPNTFYGLGMMQAATNDFMNNG